MKKIKVKIKKLSDLAEVPEYQTDWSSGADLVAAEERVIFPGETVVVKTDLAMAIPPGWELRVRPRSGLSLKTPLLVKNAPGTIDADYRGNIGVILHNMHDPDGPQGNRPYVVKVGDRIAQGVLGEAPQADFVVVDDLDETERGDGGFGHTGG